MHEYKGFCPQVNQNSFVRMSLAFPTPPRLACTHHLKKNLKHALADKIGMPRDQRQKLVKHIFSPSGIVATSNNYMELEDKFLSLIDSIDNAQIKVLLERLSPLMIENAKALDRPGLCLDNALWTNNNCESINHVLKQACSWRSLKLVDLILKLHMVVESQYREVQRAICGMGGFILIDEFKKCSVPRDIWFLKDQKQKARHMQKYFFFNKRVCIKEHKLTEGSDRTKAQREKTWSAKT